MNKLDDIVICVEPGYNREQDVYIQTRLVNKNIIIVDNMNDYCDAIKEKIESFSQKQLNAIFNV